MWFPPLGASRSGLTVWCWQVRFGGPMSNREQMVPRGGCRMATRRANCRARGCRALQASSTVAPPDPSRAVKFHILGPLEVLHDGGTVELGSSKLRGVLALLVLHANEPLSTDRLIDELWAENPPATAAKTLHVYISRLRRS